jgi:serine/threonine protein kinase
VYAPTFEGFEILEELGRGGIGIVHRARDLQLGREVAIKVLRDEYARTASWMLRFAREGRLLAELSHPNVAVVHGVGDGGRFLIMELIRGPTLADRLQGGRAVNKVHLDSTPGRRSTGSGAREGIIHRDLKPANIKIADGGQIMFRLRSRSST